MTSSSGRRRTAVAALAIAAGLLLAPVAASSATAGAQASVPGVLQSTDAAAQPALHVGVRQAAVGDPIPVTIVGAEAGAVWEVAIASPETVVGTVTIGDDGTGTTMVSLPLDTDAGSVEFTATDGAERISSSLSSAGDTAATAGGAETPAAAQEPAATPIMAALTIGVAVGAALMLVGVITFFALRRRRRASA